MMAAISEFSFPEGFLWGASTSAHQVEGNNIHNDWWAWEQAGRVKEPSGLACDHYRRFKEDFDLAASLGHNTHRFSIEWSRVEPVEGRWNDEALAHYAEAVRALRERRLEPIVTLHHFTNPQWLMAQGGWTNPAVVDRFARYVRRVAETLGDSVRLWLTINEPMVYIRMHYVQGLGPPGSHDVKQALKVTEHLIRAHAAAHRVLHGMPRRDGSKVQVSIAQYVPSFWPCRKWLPMDHWVSHLADRVFNGAFLEALTEGRWSVPGVGTWKIPEAKGTLELLGVNFYGRQFICWSPVSWRLPGSGCDLGHHPREVTERTSLGWDVHPPSFSEALLRMTKYDLPILVTENGTYMEDDTRRWSFIRRHIQAMARAMQAGAPVIGYCYWSLIDNFEWAEGFGPRFGLIDVDYATQARHVRDSARRYAEICRTNSIDLDVVHS